MLGSLDSNGFVRKSVLKSNMKHLLLILFSGVFFQGQEGRAAVCEGVRGQIQDVLFLKEPACEFAKEISDVINQMSGIFGGPPPVTLVFGGETDNASFDMGHMIQLPYHMIFFNRYGQEFPVPRASVITSAAHEYGHAIFQERLKKEFGTEYGKAFAALVEASDIKEKSFRSQAGDDDFKKFNAELCKMPEYQALNSFTTAYSEFYADLLAVYFFKDKSAMFSALYYDDMNDHDFNYVKMRDFGSSPSLRYQSMMEEDHSKLAFVRTYVGKSLWPKSEKQAKVYAEKILTAIVSVLKKDLLSGKSPSYQDMNKNLIAELKKKE